MSRLNTRHAGFPGFLRNTLGYSTHARVSLPVLNPKTGINRDFDTFQLMDHHNDMRSMLPTLKFDEKRPAFYMLNVGETHYPYMLSGADLPHISGVHGALKGMDDSPATSGKQFFEPGQMEMLRRQQIKCVEYIDGQVGRLM